MAGIFFYIQKNTLVAENKSDERSIQMYLSKFVPEVTPPIEEPVVQEEPMVEEKPVIEPKPIVEETEVKEEAIPEPIVVKVIPKSVFKEIKKKPVRKKVKKKVQKKSVKSNIASKRSKRSKAEKNKFLAKIRAKINKHKSYPRIAKKRRMHGSVKVEFTILRSGKVGHISVSGPKVFHNSAREAVKKAFPISTKNAPITLPSSINITLRYQIR